MRSTNYYPVHIQQDTSVNLLNYRNYSWVDTKENDQDNAAKSTAYLDLSMRQAVNQQLAWANFFAIEKFYKSKLSDHEKSYSFCR